MVGFNPAWLESKTGLALLSQGIKYACQLHSTSCLPSLVPEPWLRHLPNAILTRRSHAFPCITVCVAVALVSISATKHARPLLHCCATPPQWNPFTGKGRHRNAFLNVKKGSGKLLLLRTSNSSLIVWSAVLVARHYESKLPLCLLIVLMHCNLYPT